MERRWYKELGTGEKIVWVLPRMDYVGNIVDDFTVSEDILVNFKFIVLDFPEKLIQNNESWDSIIDLAQAALQFFYERQQKPDYLIGISMGGMIIQEMLALKEFINIPALIISSNVYANTKLKAAFSAWYIAVKEYGLTSFDISLFPWICKKSELPVLNTLQKLRVLKNELDISNKKICLSLNAVANHDFRERAGQVTSKIVVWIGEESVLIASEEKKAFLKFLCNADLITIPNAGMRVFTDNKEVTDKLLKKFLE